MSMRQARDTFLGFLIDNLTGYNIPVHNLRRDPSVPDSDKIQVPAVNVQFLTVTPNIQVSEDSVAIDVVHNDELTALDWMQKVWSILSSAFYTQLQDLTDPNNPVPQSTNLMWDRNSVSFKPVYSDYYCRYTCFLTLKHYMSS